MIDGMEDTLNEAEWSWLKPHALRDAVVIVDRSIDLLEAGKAIAANDKTQVSQWIERGLMTKPTAEQIASWDAAPEQRFLSLIVQPFVLVQPRLDH